MRKLWSVHSERLLFREALRQHINVYYACAETEAEALSLAKAVGFTFRGKPVIQEVRERVVLT